MEQPIGKRVKELRKEKNITMAALSESTGLSLGFLSNLERDQTSPTLANLNKICEAFGITLSELIGETPSRDDAVVVRKHERAPLLKQIDGAIQYSSITHGNTQVHASSMTINSSDVFDFKAHEHDELGIIVDGELEFTVNNKSYYLYPGDSIYVYAGSKHSARRSSEEPCTSYWVRVSPSIMHE